MNYQQILQGLYPEGSKQGQCGVFAHKLMTFPLIGDTLASKTAAVKKYGYTAAMVQGGYCAGEVIITKESLVNGHVAFCNTLENGVMTLSESNYHLDLKVHHTRQLNVHDPVIVGCIRGPLLFLPPTFNQRVLVLCSNIPDLPQVKQGIQNWVDKVKAKTTDFNILVDYETTDTQFTIVNQGATIYLQPGEVAFEGAKIEVQNKVQYDVVCLIYDNSNMNPRPNHPIEAPIYQDGFNVIEIPLDWISSIGDNTVPFEIYPNAVEVFFAHEMSHANYFLVNTRGKFLLHDKTHDDMTAGYPSPVDYFLQYLMELKPFWNFLCTTK